MAKITTNADKLSRDLERVKTESVKMYAALAQNVFDQMAIDSTGNMRIMGGGTTGRNLWRSLKTNPPLPKTLTSRSGRIVASLNNKVFRNKKEAIRELNPTAIGVTLVYGSIVPYANIHDKGGSFSVSRGDKSWRVNMPARPYVSKALLELPKKMQKLFDMAYDKTLGRILK